MASIVLSAVGTAVGAATGLGPFGSALGGAIGRGIGSLIDDAILPGTKLKPINGPRLLNLAVQSSTYGKMIPIIYGSMRLGGNIIWSQPIQETATTTTSTGGGKGGSGKVSQTTTNYSYSVTLAVAICEGPVDDVLRIWADAQQLDLSQFTVRIYKGDEVQTPDSLIVSIEGADSTPAYRGLAYVIFENFPLANYGNRIPNFTFEVKKKALYPDYNGWILEDQVDSMIMIPGAGEFVYDTQLEYKIPGELVGADWVQSGSQQNINMQNPEGEANALLSLDQLAATCPNIEWVSVVVSWFGTDMDAGACVVLPGVEYQTGATTSPDTWAVAGFDRSTAHLITQISGSPQYGGTPDDDSILRYLTELRNRGYNIMFYPMMFMDVTDKPWRGELTGSATDVGAFFTKTNGFNAFVTHYANLVNGYVDGFIIGSELVGLTKVTDTPGNYPAVNQLVSLAATVKGILGSSVTVTYAADWSEYHHTDGGWYNLDPLWASANIDVIGIDAYFPLTDAPQDGYDIPTIIAGWTSGEGYDFYYTDPARTIKASLSPPYAWKNIAWFWNNTHTNPDSTTTAWVPNSKKIWFTEYGFPSVDGATNQPNVFYDPTSSSSAFPRFSKGRVDFVAQRVGHVATQAQWAGSSMIERMFIWTWDARPFPYWPDLTAVWSDGANWITGHWVEGKFGTSSLVAIISDICLRAGLQSADIDVSDITDQVDGFFISNPQTYRDSIEALQQAYFFDVVESDNVLKFITRGGNSVLAISEDDLVPPTGKKSNELFNVTRLQEVELPKRVNVVYMNRLSNYQSSTQYSQREITSSLEVVTVDLPIVCDDQVGKNIADITLFSQWMGRTGYQFSLPVQYAQLEPTDVITVTVSGVTHRMRILSSYMSTSAMLQLQGVAEDVSTFDFYSTPGGTSVLLTQTNGIPATDVDFLDIPAFPGDDAATGILRLAACGLSSGWTGAALYRSDDGGSNYGQIVSFTTPSSIGTAQNALASGPTTVFDYTNTLSVLFISSAVQLQSVSELAVLNGANAAMLGSELIQFTTATLVSPGQYTLSGLLRGRLGTEWAVGTHSIGESFVMLDGTVAKQSMAGSLIGKLRQYKPVTFGSSLTSAIEQDFTYNAVCLKPYSPVQISGARDMSGNLTINWFRRTHVDGNWEDNVDVPLNETSEAYEIDVMNGGVVVRAITGLLSPTASYSAAQQITDFGSPQSTVSVNVYQLSGVVGRGYAGVAVV